MKEKSSFHFLLLALFVILQSCNHCKLWGVTELGNNFSLVESDEDHVALNYCISSCCDSGIPIVPSNIVEYNSSSKWIIAKSKTYAVTNYWLIDKDFKVKLEYDNGMKEKIMSHVYGPVDSLIFYKKLEELRIQLNFKKYVNLQ